MERWQTLLIILGGITAVIGFYKKVLKPTIKWITRWNTMFKEFIPDSGKSMKDQVTNIEILACYLKSVQDAQIRLDNLAIITCNGGGRCISVNKSWCDLSGLTQNEALGWGWLNAVLTEDRERVKEDWITAINDNSEFNSTYKFINKVTKDVFNVEAICLITRNSQKEVVSIVGTVVRLKDNEPVKGEKSIPE